MTFDGVRSWNDFETSLYELGKKAKGDAFEQLTYWFFRLNEVHASQYEEVWLWQDVPERVKSSLNLPNQDLGIDLLLQKGDEYHAVQCKYHSSRHASVTFREVATFLSVLESNDRITLGYICSSANGFSANLKKVSQNTKQVQRVLSDTWSRLDQSFFDAIRLEEQGQTRRLEPFQPRAHQREAIENAVKHFKADENRRGKLIFPCGSGKSLTGYWIAQALNSKKTLVAVPSLSLVKQTIEVYLRESVANKRRVKWICICSDDGIGRGDDVVMYHNDLGVPCETNLDEITKWLEANANENIIVFTTYQSGRVIAEAAQNCGVEFDLGIFDEAHKTVGSREKLFSHLLFDENIAIARRVFMTATERFYRGLKDVIISMEDEQIYGETFAQMTFKEAIEQQLLTDYKVITIEVQEAEVADFIRQNNLIELDSRWGKEAEARSLASMLALRKAMKRFPIRNAVSFHGTIDKAKRCKELQTYITDSYGYAPIDSYTVSGNISTTKRNDIVHDFARSERALITNARCLTEGVDVPNIDCIVFADPKRSKVDIVQALGRALRRKEGKDWGYVVLPVIYDEATGRIDNENFSEIFSVVRGLASNDERIVEYFRSLHQSQNRKKSSEENEQFQFDVFSDHFDEDILAEQLTVRLWEKLGRFNWLPFHEAREFARASKATTFREWRELCDLKLRPANIPAWPNLEYRNSGWSSWVDFLGGAYRNKKNKQVPPFQEAKRIIREKGIKSYRQYNSKELRPFLIQNNLPISPASSYSENWKSWGDFLGTGNSDPTNYEYVSYDEASEWAKSLEIKTGQEYKRLHKTYSGEKRMPSSPRRVYEKFTSWGDFLGTGRVASHRKKFRTFEEARAFVRTLGIRTTGEWHSYAASGKKPADIPSQPAFTYKDKGYSGIKDWLGTEPSYMTFENARLIASALGLKSRREWHANYDAFAKADSQMNLIPKHPDIHYTIKWQGWPNFLGNEKMDFLEAREKVRELSILTMREWKERYSQLVSESLISESIPKTADRAYAESGWVSWSDFLGTED